MDNLQETYIYLAAMLDGEGYVQCVHIKRANGKEVLKAAIAFSNTDTRIVKNIHEALLAIGVNPHIHASKRNVKNGGLMDYTVQLCRLPVIKKFLLCVLQAPRLAKRIECELLLEFIELRLGPNGEPWPRGGTGLVRSVAYQPRCYEIQEEISTYGCHKNRKLGTPQRAYVWQASTPEDVLCSAMKVAESAEMTDRPQYIN